MNTSNFGSVYIIIRVSNIHFAVKAKVVKSNVMFTCNTIMNLLIKNEIKRRLLLHTKE